MKKQKHPNKTTTNLQLKDGGIYFKK